ncbi:hypothetical protein D3C76_1501460 [compost metagenome]
MLGTIVEAPFGDPLRAHPQMAGNREIPVEALPDLDTSHVRGHDIGKAPGRDVPPVRQTCRKEPPVVHRIAIGGVSNVIGRQRATVNLQDHLAGRRNQTSLQLFNPTLVQGVFTGYQPCYRT